MNHLKHFVLKDMTFLLAQIGLITHIGHKVRLENDCHNDVICFSEIYSWLSRIVIFPNSISTLSFMVAWFSTHKTITFILGRLIVDPEFIINLFFILVIFIAKLIVFYKIDFYSDFFCFGRK